MAFDRYPMNAKSKFALTGGTQPGANTDFLGASKITAKAPGGTSLIRVCIQVATGSIFKARINDGVAGAKDFKLNAGVALTAGCLYTFTFTVGKGYTVDFQTTSAVDVDLFCADECVGGVS